MNAWAKALVSLALLFHLSAVFVFPNPESVLSRQTSWLFFPYGNFLGLNTTWRFFSPNPAILKLEYEAYGYSEDGGVDYEKKGSFPENIDSVGTRESFNRLMNFSMLVSAHEQNYETVLKSYFCGLHPEADEISFFHLEYVLPSLESSRIKAGDFESLVKEKRSQLPAVNCTEEEV